jgi:hypothetical protein
MNEGRNNFACLTFRRETLHALEPACCMLAAAQRAVGCSRSDGCVYQQPLQLDRRRQIDAWRAHGHSSTNAESSIQAATETTTPVGPSTLRNRPVARCSTRRVPTLQPK